MISLENQIAQLTINHFNSLPKTGKPNSKEWTILASIVQQNTQDNTLKIISLATGSKCIGESKLCPNGTILNDSHAEVLCRRGFLKYLYNQIDLLYNANPLTIFTKDNVSNKGELKEQYNFHMFCSQIPCGDAAIFPKQNNENLTGVCLEANDEYVVSDKNNKRTVFSDINRTGAKCLKSETRQDPHQDGANYHITGAIRTKPGRGDPTLSLSCSDKFARWIRLGIQGALLTLMIKNPIYLDSIILARNINYSEEAFQRALTARFSSSEIQLNSPFSIHIPKILQSNIDFPQKTEDLQLCPSSIIWVNMSHRPILEIAVNGRRQGVTKKNLLSNKSLLSICKRRLFSTFLEIIEKYPQSIPINACSLTYGDLKTKCLEYNINSNIVKNEIFKLWTNKDSRLLKFCI